MVGRFGSLIRDSQTYDIEDDVPELNIDDVSFAFDNFRKHDYNLVKDSIRDIDWDYRFLEMIDRYYSKILSVIEEQ